MPLVVHLHGLPTLSGSVGQGGGNANADVKSIKALLNAYLRATGQPALAVDATVPPSLPQAIESFQRQHLKIERPTGVWIPKVRR